MQYPPWIQKKNAGSFEVIAGCDIVIQAIFKLAAKRLCVADIIEQLEYYGVPPLGRSASWNTSRVRDILKSPAAYGERLSDPSYYPAAIDKEKFLSVKKLREGMSSGSYKGKEKGSPISNLLADLVECGYCGKRMIMDDAYDPTGTLIDLEKAYVCPIGKKPKSDPTKKCICRPWKYSEVEWLVRKILRVTNVAKLENDDVALDLAKSNRIRGYPNSQQAKLKDQVARMKELLDELDAIEDKADVDQHDVRRRLSGQFRQVIEYVAVYPLGELDYLERMQAVKAMSNKDRNKFFDRDRRIAVKLKSKVSLIIGPTEVLEFAMPSEGQDGYIDVRKHRHSQNTKHR